MLLVAADNRIGPRGEGALQNHFVERIRSGASRPVHGKDHLRTGSQQRNPVKIRTIAIVQQDFLEQDPFG